MRKGCGSKMKKIKANILPITQLLILIILVILPFIFNFANCFSNMLWEEINLDNWMFQIFSIIGNSLNDFFKNILFGLILALFYMFIILNNWNKEKTLNHSNVYNDYPYFWYWVCSKILKYKKCNLINVPIFMQFKLILNNTFLEYPFDENVFPEKNNDEIFIEKDDAFDGCSEINLILEDTYLIDDNQIPQNQMETKTIRIRRNNGVDFNRYYSPAFIEKIVNVVRDLPDGVKINIFATTNPKNTMYIAKNAFNMADRGNVNNLIVFQQSNSSNNRVFLEKGIGIL